MSNALFARSAATEQLIDLLKSCAEGAVVTYAEMARVTNRDIQFTDRHLLDTAQNHARKDGAVFSCEIRVGMRRMLPGEVQHDGRRRVRWIHSAARRGSKVMDAVTSERMTPDERLGHSAVRGVLATIQAGSHRAAFTSIEANRDPAVTVVIA